MAVLYPIFNEVYGRRPATRPRVTSCAARRSGSPRSSRRSSRRARAVGPGRRSCSSSTRARPRGSGPTDASPLDDQDRRLWDAELIAQGETAIHDAAEAGWVGGYASRRRSPANTSGPRRRPRPTAGDRGPLRRPGRRHCLARGRLNVPWRSREGGAGGSLSLRVDCLAGGGRLRGITSSLPSAPTSSAASAEAPRRSRSTGARSSLRPEAPIRRSLLAGAERCRMREPPTKLSLMARKIPSLCRFLLVRALYAMAYGDIRARSTTRRDHGRPRPFADVAPLRRRGFHLCPRGPRRMPRAGRGPPRRAAVAFARRAFNDLVGFMAYFFFSISLSVLFLPYYLGCAHGVLKRGLRLARSGDAVGIVLVVTVVRTLRRTECMAPSCPGRCA